MQVWKGRTAKHVYISAFIFRWLENDFLPKQRTKKNIIWTFTNFSKLSRHPTATGPRQFYLLLSASRRFQAFVLFLHIKILSDEAETWGVFINDPKTVSVITMICDSNHKHFKLLLLSLLPFVFTMCLFFLCYFVCFCFHSSLKQAY